MDNITTYVLLFAVIAFLGIGWAFIGMDSLKVVNNILWKADIRENALKLAKQQYEESQATHPDEIVEVVLPHPNGKGRWLAMAYRPGVPGRPEVLHYYPRTLVSKPAARSAAHIMVEARENRMYN